MTRKNRPDIESLLAERTRYEAWLAQLAAKASTVPAHVVERVRADYQERATRIIEELKTRADELRTETASLEQRIAALSTDLNAKRDARAEDELRSLVGEYEGDAWQKKASEHDRVIAALDAERTMRESELTRVKELLADATRPSRQVRAISEAEVPDVPTPAATNNRPVAAPAPAPPPPAAPIAADPGAKRTSPFDELGFLRTVVGRATPLGVPVQNDAQPAVPHAPVAVPPPPTAPPVPAAAAAPPSAQPPAPVAPQMPPQPVPQYPPPAAAVAAQAAQAVAAPPLPPQPAPRRSIPNFEPPPIPDAPVAAPAQASAPVAPATPAAANELITFGAEASDERSPRNSQSARTLKCQECGWMNYPTEWYCEKCGGELAAF